MRFVTILALTGCLGVGAVFLVAAPGSGQGTALPDFPLSKSVRSPGQVTFSHAKHRAKVDKCASCHSKDFKTKRGTSGPITMATMQTGKFCGACHDGKTQIGGATVFSISECIRCHMP
jgi:c(7)-type cytochrome triheme protein